MAITINVDGFDINNANPIDKRLIVDSVSGPFPSLITLDTAYNYTNMIVWVRDEKAFYYLIDSPPSDGAVASDWVKFSGGATGGCAKSGYVSGTSFIGDDPATASVVFGTPYESASYSVVVTGEFFGEALIYSIVDKNPSGFIIQAEAGVPLGATAMWITNCWDGSGLSSGGAAGAQGPTGPGGSTADTAGRRGWESGQSFSTPSGGYTLTASSTASTIFFPISNSFDSPQGDIVVTLDPNLAISDINRNFRLVVDNLQRIESGSTWSIVAPMEGFDPGDRILEWSEGRIEPQVLEFVWNDSARSGLGGYEMFRYLAEPFVRNNLSGLASSRDFITTKRQTGFFGGNIDETVSSIGSSTVYPAGSILFIKEAFVTCEGNTTTGVTVSFGLRESDGATIPTSEFTPNLTTFDISSTDQIIFPNKSLNDFATGSVFYSDSPVGVVRINRPMMIYMRLTGGDLQPGTFLKCVVPYIVDEFSFTVASGLGGQIASPNNQSGSFAIDLEEIAFGTGTGITSSDVFTFNNTNTSLILGFDNTITDSRSSAIIGGTGNTIRDSFYSSIQSSDKSIICRSDSSSIISGCGNWICCSDGSVILNSSSSFLTNSSTHSIIINSDCVNIKNSEFSNIISGYCSNIYGSSNVGIKNSSGVIIATSSYSSIISSGLFSAILNSSASVNLAGIGDKIFDSFNSSSLSSITSLTCCGCRTSIIGSGLSCIIQSCNSVIMGSQFSRIVGNCHNTIISSTGSSIVSYSGFSGIVNLSNSVIMGGHGHCIRGAKNSAIIGGVDRCLVRCAIGGSGINDGFDNVVALPSIMGCASLALGIATSSTDGIILDDNYFTLIAYPPEPSGTMDVCLPSVSSYIIGRIYVIKKNGSSTQSTVNVCPYSTQCIDGYAGYVELINPWDYYMLQADGVDNWIKLGGAVGLNL